QPQGPRPVGTPGPGRRHHRRPRGRALPPAPGRTLTGHDRVAPTHHRCVSAVRGVGHGRVPLDVPGAEGPRPWRLYTPAATGRPPTHQPRVAGDGEDFRGTSPTLRSHPA